MAYAERRRGEGRSTEKAKIKKRDMHRKQGQKPHRIALRCAGACSFSAFSILPLRLRDRRRAGPVPQIQTNSSGSYRRSNKCRTFTFSSEGSATVSSPPPPRHQPPVRAPTAIPAFFDDVSFPPVLQPFLPRSRSRSRIALGNEGARVCNFIMYDGFPRTVHS